MYNKVIIVTVLMLIIKVSKSQNLLLIDGESNYFTNGTKIIIKKRLPFNSILSYQNYSDTCVIKNKRFKFRIKASNSELYILSVIKNDQDLWCRIFLQPGNARIYINDSLLKNVTVKENKTALDFKRFEKFIYSKSDHAYLSLKAENYKKILKVDSIKAEILKEELIRIKGKVARNEILNVIKWIKSNPNSQINSNIIYDYLRKNIQDEELRKVFYKLPISNRRNAWAQELDYFLNRLAIGKIPPDFNQSDTSGNEIVLSKFLGKYILLDFWASWCRPCREATPELVKTYNKFRNKNFEIISIALDENRDKWIKALVQDAMIWVNVSDLKFWKNEIAISYNITSIPFNILINEKGIIIAKNVWREDLNRILKKGLQ